jgi:hypothetical protein
MGALRGPRRIKETRFHKLSSLFKLPMRRLADSRREAELGPTTEGVWQFRNVVRYLVRLKRAVLWRFQHCAYRCERLDQLEGAHNLSSNNSCRAFAHFASIALVNTPYEGTEPTIRNKSSGLLCFNRNRKR